MPFFVSSSFNSVLSPADSMVSVTIGFKGSSRKLSDKYNAKRQKRQENVIFIGQLNVHK
jgi:hypothetical protein